MNICSVARFRFVMGLVLLAASGACAASPPARPVHPGEAVIRDYVQGEVAAGDLFSFCAFTRPFVRTPADYPDCPPHDRLSIVADAQMEGPCHVSGHEVSCTVAYREAATSGSTNNLSPIASAKRRTRQKLHAVLTAEGWRVRDPYLAAHVGLRAVRGYLGAELKRLGGMQHELSPEQIGYLVETAKNLELLR